jgi:hypothetical protein
MITKITLTIQIVKLIFTLSILVLITYFSYKKRRPPQSFPPQKLNLLKRVNRPTVKNRINNDYIIVDKNSPSQLLSDFLYFCNISAILAVNISRTEFFKALPDEP